MRSSILVCIFISIFGLLFVSCNSQLTSASKDATELTYSVTVSWAANIEKAVNQSGGGYRIYYSKQSSFEPSEGQFKSVQYISGSTTPTSATISGLTKGTYYIKVVAFSSLPSVQDSTSSVSSPSSEVSVTVP